MNSRPCCKSYIVIATHRSSQIFIYRYLYNMILRVTMRLLLITIIITRAIIYYWQRRQISEFDPLKYTITVNDSGAHTSSPLNYTTVTETVSSPRPRHVHQSHKCKNHAVVYRYIPNASRIAGLPARNPSEITRLQL